MMIFIFGYIVGAAVFFVGYVVGRISRKQIPAKQDQPAEVAAPLSRRDPREFYARVESARKTIEAARKAKG